MTECNESSVNHKRLETVHCMNYTNPELLARIEAFSLDAPGVTLSFTARLARENGWTRSFASRVVEEYKRFAYLAMQAGHPVTPSEEVDQAWHLHMVYTRSYWTNFCGEVLQRPLHHEPTQGGATEGAKFHDWYARTLESYEREFGHPPPPDVWPSVKQRFASAGQQRWVDPTTHWILPKLNFAKRLRALAGKSSQPAVAVGLGILAVTVVTGCVSQESRGVNIFNWGGTDFLLFYIACLVVATVLTFRRKGNFLAQQAELPPANVRALNPYSLAFLKGGPALVAQAAVLKLIALRCLEFKKSLLSTSIQKLPRPEGLNDLDEIESTVLMVNADKNETISQSAIMAALRPSFERIREDLTLRGLLQDGGARRGTNLSIMLPMLLCMGLGLIKLAVGIMRDKPVGFLVALLFITFVFGLMIANTRPRRSREGEAVLEAKQSAWNQQQAYEPQLASLSAAMIPMALVCGGASALAPWGLDQTAQHVQKSIAHQGSADSGCGSGWSSDGSGSGCSGGGDSGCGGGGCGGCGGGGGD